MLGSALGGCAERVESGPGIFAPESPLQIPTDHDAVEHNGFVLEPQAAFRITAKLLSKRRYRWDRLATIAPWDYAMGWGPMSDEALLRKVSITQGDRFLFRHLLDPGLSLRQIEKHSANLHLIPLTSAVEEQLAAVPLGVIATLEGQLVDALDRERGERLPTSVSRDDVGAGACEILLVERVSYRAPGAAPPG